MFTMNLFRVFALRTKLEILGAGKAWKTEFSCAKWVLS